jgi:hypothetical protein
VTARYFAASSAARIDSRVARRMDHAIRSMTDGPTTSFDAFLRASDALSGPKCMMISAKMRRGSCFVNFNVVLIASMFVLVCPLFA